MHTLMSPKHSWTLGSGPHPYSISGTLTATASDSSEVVDPRATS